MYKRKPYWPTEPPAEIDIIAEKEAINPDFILNFSLLECADKITSGGPCHLFPNSSFLKRPTTKPARAGKKSTNKKKSFFKTSSGLFTVIFFFLIIEVRKSISSRKQKTPNEVILPIRLPTKSVEKIIFSRFSQDFPYYLVRVCSLDQF